MRNSIVILLTLLFLNSTVFAQKDISINSGDARTSSEPTTSVIKSNLKQKNSSAILPAPPQEVKFFLKNNDRNKKLISILNKYNSRSITYNDRQLFSINRKEFLKLPKNYRQHIVERPELTKVYLPSTIIDSTITSDYKKQPSANITGLYIIQYAGPIKSEWGALLAKNKDIKIINSLKTNAYLVRSSSDAINKISNDKNIMWIGNYRDAYKINPLLNKPVTSNIEVTIQLIISNTVNNTIERILSKGVKLSRPTRKLHQFVFMRVTIPATLIKEIASFPDVLYIDDNGLETLGGERQDISSTGIFKNILSKDTPMPPTDAANGEAYIDWINNTFRYNTPGPSPVTIEASTQFNTFAIDVVDSGIDDGTISGGTLHPDLNGRVTYQRRVTGVDVSATTPSSNLDFNNHGTLVASVVAGFNNTVTGSDANQVEATDGFHFGLGISPYSLVASSKIFISSGITGPDLNTLHSTAYAMPIPTTIFNHSWGESGAAQFGEYNAESINFDNLVRDAQPGIGASEQAVIIGISGNTGWTSATGGYIPLENPPTISTSGQKSSLWNHSSTAKNVIVVGASENSWPGMPASGCTLANSGSDNQDVSDIWSDDTRDTLYLSSRGPTLDGRFKPDLVAPGVRISGGKSSSLTELVCTYPSGANYVRHRGTSFSAPAVAGAAALLKQHYINKKIASPDQYNYVTTSVTGSSYSPSPALTKAWLMNSTSYLTRPGAESNDPIDNNDADPALEDDLPSNVQGMGLLNVRRAFDTVPRIIRDQHFIFDGDIADVANSTNRDIILRGVTGNGDENAANGDEPFRVTLTWTDYPGNINTALTTSSVLQNNLDLFVCIGTYKSDCSSPGVLYNGNNFNRDVSQPGTVAESINNVESVWLPPIPAGTEFFVRVTPETVDHAATSLSSDATMIHEQDFALVIYNATIPDDSTAIPVTDNGEQPIASILRSKHTMEHLDDSSDPIVTMLPQSGSSMIISSVDTTSLDPAISIIYTSDTDIRYTVSDSVAMGDIIMTSFDYTITDGHGATKIMTANISITGSNDAPITANDGSLAAPLTVAESVAESVTGFVISVLSNDTDIDGTLDVTSVNITSGPTFGSAVENPDGSITYTASPDFVGTSQFSYTVNDNTGATSDIATVYINVTPSNDSPDITAPTATLFQLQNTTMMFAPANAISIDDVDVNATTGGFDVTISVPAPGNGTFNASGPAGVISGDGTNNISFSGNLSTVNAALATLSYTGNLGITGSETVTINVDDNGNSGAADEPNMVSTTFDITLTSNAPPQLELDADDNNRPTANNIDFENTFDLGTGNPIEIAEGTTITDADTPSPVSVTATITNPLNGSDETLTIAGSTSGVTGNIAFSYSSAVLSLSPNAGATPTNAEYAAAIDLIRYDNNATATDTTNRIINITVNDGISMDSATSTIDFQRRPVDITLVLDTSGSMRQLVDGTQRIDLLKDAVQLFLETWDGFDIPEDRLSTIYFNTNISSFPASLALESFATNWSAHNTNIASQIADGWTSFGAGLQTAIENLNTAPSGGLNHKPVVIAFTDGQQNGTPMVMRPGSNYASGDPVPILDALTPYQILDATVTEMVDDGFSVRTLSGITQASPPISLSSTDTPINIHTIGTGVSGSNLEVMLSKLAADTGGEDFFATPADFISVGGIPSPLQDHFMTTLVNSLSETSLEMVGRVFSQLPSNRKIKSHKFTLNNATQRASFVLSWNKNINMDELAFQLKTPQGDFIPAGTRGIDIRSSDYYFIVHLEFPLISRFNSISAGGEWEMILQRKNFQLPPPILLSAATATTAPSAVDYSVWVLEDESDVKDRVKSDKPRYKVGEAILLTTRVTDIARKVKEIFVNAKVRAPKVSLGTYLAKNYIRDIKTLSTRVIASTSSATTLLDTPQTLYDKNLSHLLNSTDLPKELNPLTSNLRLLDNGKNGDKVANDGIFSALYTDTSVPGSYRFNISIKGRLPINGNISRQSTITVVTEFDSFDINKSTITYADIDPHADIKNANKQLLITPIDKFGNLLGPGKSQLIRITIKNGDLIGSLQDRGDGSYMQYLLANGLLVDPIISIDAPGATMIAVDTQNEMTLIEWVLIVILIIILLVILCWLIKLAYRLLKK